MWLCMVNVIHEQEVGDDSSHELAPCQVLLAVSLLIVEMQIFQIVTGPHVSHVIKQWNGF